MGFLNKILNNDREIYTKLYDDALKYMDEYNFDKSLSIFKYLLEKDFESVKVLENMIKIYSNLKLYDNALECANCSLSKNPNSFQGLANKGELLYNLKRYDEALYYIDKALNFNDININSVKLLKVNTLIHLKQFDEAKAMLKSIKFNSIEENDADLLNLKADILYSLNEFEECIKFSNMALKLNPKLYGAYFNEGLSFIRLSDYENALNVFNQALEIKTDDYKLWYNKGLTLYYLTLYEKSIISFDNAYSLKKDEISLKAKGSSLLKLKRFDEALNTYKLALEINPEDLGLYSNIAATLIELKDYNQAITYCNKVLEIDENNINALFYKGNALKYLGDFDSSLICYDLILELDSADEDTILEKKDLLNKRSS